MADDILDEADEFIQDGGYAGPLVRKMRDEIERLREQLAKAGEKWVVAEMKARCALDSE